MRNIQIQQEQASMSSSRSSKYNFSDHEYITLISAEGFEFIISKRAASGSKMLREMMTSAKGT